MPVNPDDYDEVVRRINAKYNGDIKRGDEYEDVTGIPTPSPELNAAMGGMGVPRGRWTRFYGGYHSTKTLNALATLGNAQRMGLTCAYYNIEKQYDAEFAEQKLGVNTHDLHLVEGTSIEEIGEKMESLFGVVHVHCIDSVSIAVSEDELNADIRDWRPGISARAWGKVFRRLNERFDHVDNTVIMIDQVRTNFKTGGEDAPGGRIIDHQSSMTVHFKKSGWLYRNADGDLDDKAAIEKGPSGQAEPSGIEIKARVEKSRVCRPFRAATMRLDFDTMQFDRIFELVKAAKHYGVLENTAVGRYALLDAKGKVLKKFHGDKQIRAHLVTDPELQEKIAKTMMEVAGR